MCTVSAATNSREEILQGDSMFYKEYILPDGTNKTKVIITCDIAEGDETVDERPALLICAEIVDCDNRKRHIKYDILSLPACRLFNLVTNNPTGMPIISAINILDLFHDGFDGWCSGGSLFVDKEPPEICKILFERLTCSWRTTAIAEQFAQTIAEDIKTHYRKNFEKNYPVSSMPEDMAVVYQACQDLYNFRG